MPNLQQLAAVMPQQEALLAQIQHYAATLDQQNAAVIQRLDALQEGRVELSLTVLSFIFSLTSQQRLLFQLRNATAPLDAPLAYPQDVVIAAGFPGTKRELLSLTGKLYNRRMNERDDNLVQLLIALQLQMRSGSLRSRNLPLLFQIGVRKLSISSAVWD